MLVPGTTILIPSGPINDPQRLHLFVIVARKEGPPRQVLIVGISSMGNAYQDDTVCFVAGDHDFIQHPSYVRYSDARTMEEAALMRGLGNGTMTQHSDCSADFLNRVVRGFEFSPAAKPFCVEFIDESD